MLFQLGNKTFEGLYAPSQWNRSGNEANLAEYDLINTKPRLQLTGETLEEISLSFKLRVEFCNPAQEVADLEAWKKTGEVLPLLLGSGEYVNDYVIKGITKNIVQTFSDGTPIELGITIDLLEFVPSSAADQQTATDRRSAAAVGDKTQTSRRPTQPKTPEAQAHQALMKAENSAWEAANAADEARSATTPANFADKVNGKVKQAQKAMDDARQRVSDVQQNINNATGIIAAVDNAKDKLQELGTIMTPPISTQDLNDAILNLQTGVRGVDTNSTVFTTDIILRKL